MRAELARHFDVIVVIWGLTLMVGFICAGLCHSQLTNDQWLYQQHSGPAWMVPAEP